jgi:NAD(P)-dependent dehydrogenase (short-subunit alcohol dehydrogenase family)
MHSKLVALVTGGNQGIGLQIARELATKDFTVLVGSRNLARGVEAAASIAGDARATQLGLSMQESAKLYVASKISLDEVRAIWETNVFGVLAVYQALLPLLREAPAGRIVNVSSGVGSLTRNADPAFPYRKIFTPGYSASKTALNAMTLAMAIELEGTSIKVNAVSPGFTKTNLNGYEGTETVEEGAAEAVRMALLGPDGPSGSFTHATLGTLPW